MKPFPLLLLTMFVLSACGGSGGSAVPAKSNATGVTTATFEVQIPKAVTAASANSRTPQYIAPQTTFFLVDLQGNSDPQFSNTFLVNDTNCPPSTAGSVTCVFTATIPGGDPTSQRWSVAAGSGNKTDGTSGAPLSVAHNVTPCLTAVINPSCGMSTTMPNNNVVIFAALNAIVANIGGVSFGAQNFTPIESNTPNPPNPAPYFTFLATDAFGNSVRGAYTSDAPIGDWGFENPFTFTEDDTSGQLLMDEIEYPDFGFYAAGPVSSLTFSTLAGLHGGVAAIRIDDDATTVRTMHIAYSVPEVDLLPSEFPQLKATWTSPGKTGTLLTLTCVPTASVTAGTNPCTSN